MTDERRYPHRMAEIKAALEQKAGGSKPRVRRVRSAEGARKYGQPIGSIIVIDGRTGRPIASPEKKPTTPDAPSAPAKPDAPSAPAKPDSANVPPKKEIPAIGKDGKPIEIGKRYRVPTEDGRHDGLWEAMTFQNGEYHDPKNPAPIYVLSMLVGPDGKVDASGEVRRFKASSLIPDGVKPEEMEIADTPTYAGKRKGSRSQNIMKLTPEQAKQAQEDYATLRRNGKLRPSAQTDLFNNKFMNFANTAANMQVTISQNNGRWQVRVDNGDTQLLKADAARSAVYADNPGDALLLAALAYRSWERRAYEKDGSGKKDAFGRRAANRRPRDFDGFNAYDDGIRGLDWKMESDPDVDWTDKAARRRMVDKELAELGTTVRHLKPEMQAYEDFDVEHLENIARTLRTHENQYPGIVRKMFPELRFDPARGKNIAYTNVERSYGFKEGQEQWQYMGFSADWFGNRQERGQSRESQWAAYRPKQSPERPVGFGVNAPEDLLASGQFESFTEAGVVDVTTHEMGHNVGFVLYGMMGRNRKHESQELMESPDPRARLTNKYREEFFRILDAYGILDSNVQITYDEYRKKNKAEDTPMSRRSFANYQSKLLDDSGKGTSGQEYDARVMNRDALAEHLSRYGSTNLQELMAETWTGYQHNPEPGDFVREMGALMDDVLIDFLDDTQAGPEADFLGAARSETRKREVAYRDTPWPEGMNTGEVTTVETYFDKLYPKRTPERIVNMLLGVAKSEYPPTEGVPDGPTKGAGFFTRQDGTTDFAARGKYLDSFLEMVKGFQNTEMNRNPVTRENDEVEADMEKRGFSDTEKKAYMLAREHARAVGAILMTRTPEPGRHRKDD